MKERVSILVVDNYDSFVYNLVQYLGELGADVSVRRNDAVGSTELSRLDVDGVVISPGPGHPSQAGNCVEVIRHCAASMTPLLGVCLGHQAIVEAFGGVVKRAPELFHGRASLVEHDGRGVFSGVANPVVVGRYHSLVVDELPAELTASAHSNGVIMGLRHATFPIEGIQFHPESVLTEDGYLMLANWLESCGQAGVRERVTDLALRANALRASLPQPS